MSHQSHHNYNYVAYLKVESIHLQYSMHKIVAFPIYLPYLLQTQLVDMSNKLQNSVDWFVAYFTNRLIFCIYICIFSNYASLMNKEVRL